LFSRIKDDFNRSLVVSVAVHTGLILLAFVGGKTIFSSITGGDVEIIRSSVRVDVVGMPKFTVQELKAMQNNMPKETPVEQAKGETAEVKPKEEDTQDVIKKDDLVVQEADKSKTKKSFLNILSEASSKKVEKKEKGPVAGKGNKNLEALVLEGNRLSKGSALVGDYSDAENSEFSAYVQTLPELIRQFWRLPTYLMDKDLRCRIKIFLSSSGQVLKTELMESSGQSEFDARAMKAIRDAAPFPRPSESVGTRLNNSGIILGFPL